MDVYSQTGLDIGITAGESYYIGEYNPSGHFQKMQGYVGGFFRFNLNDRYALRFNGNFSKITIDDVKWPGNEEFPTSFHTSVSDLACMVEFNFRSFMVPKIKRSSLWSPYMFLGGGLLLTKERMDISLPFGVGVKFNLVHHFSVGVELGGRKLFSDKMDGLEDVWTTGESNLYFSKDWFFATGITISYRIPFREDCLGY